MLGGSWTGEKEKAENATEIRKWKKEREPREKFEKDETEGRICLLGENKDDMWMS